MNPYARPPGYGYGGNANSYQQEGGYGRLPPYAEHRDAPLQHPHDNRSSHFMQPPPMYAGQRYGGRGFQEPGSRPQYGSRQGMPQQYGYQTSGGYGQSNYGRGRGTGFRRNEFTRNGNRRDSGTGAFSYFKPSMLEDPWKELIAKLEKEHGN